MTKIVPYIYVEDPDQSYFQTHVHERGGSAEFYASVGTQGYDEEYDRTKDLPLIDNALPPYLLVGPAGDEHYTLTFLNRAEFERFRDWLDVQADRAWTPEAPNPDWEHEETKA